MRSLRLKLVPVVLSLCACTCTEKARPTTGIFAMTPKSLDFGIGCLNETTERQILLENRGNATLTVTDQKFSGAQFALLEEIPRTIEPGQQIAVRIGFTPPDAQEYAGALELTTDAATDPKQRASFVGQGFSGKRQDFKVLCESAAGSGQFDTCRFLSFDNVLAGTHLDRVARLSNAGCAPVDVNEAFFYPDPSGAATADEVKLFSFTGDPAPYTLHGGTTKDVTVRFTAPDHATEPSVRAQFTSNDPEKKDSHWKEGVWDLGLFANAVAPALLVDTEVLTFFDARTGVGDERTFVVSNQGSADLRIDSLAIVAEAGTTDFQLKAGDEGPFTLTPTGTATDNRKITVVYTSSGPGSDQGKVVVTAGQEKREVRLIAGTEPMLVVKWLDGNNHELDPPVDFGQVATGTKGTTRVVRLRNDGQAPLAVAGVDLPAAENPAGSYKLLAPFTPGPIAAGQHVDVTVTFDDAVTLRDDAAKLRVTSDDPIDASNGGEHLVDLDSRNEPNFKPVPAIEICAHASGSATCTTAPQLALELDVDGTKSTGPEPGDTLTFLWSMPVKPAGSSARLEKPTDIRTRLVSAAGTKLDLPGNYVVKLTVTDQFNNTNFLSQSINVSR